VLVGREQRQQSEDPLRPDARAVIVTPDVHLERTGRGIWSRPPTPDRRQVRQEGYHLAPGVTIGVRQPRPDTVAPSPPG
jgi:hypothetical protein